MVFGFFEGGLELRVNGTSFSPGQKITGTVVVNPDKPKQARELRVLFYGEIMTRSGRHHNIQRILQTRQIISGEKMYSRGESFDFELTLPQPLEFQAPDNAVGDAIAAIQLIAASMVPAQPRGWFVHATLDIPGSADLNKRAQITIVGEMIKTVKVSANTKEEQLALTQHNIELQRKLTAGTALFGDAPMESQPAQPPQTGQPPV